jgi:hypothetical protein
VRVQKRHIIYVQGYDPRGLAQYYRMFRTELRKFARLYGVETTIGRPTHALEDTVASWTIETRSDDWQTQTRYDFLRWEDLIQRDLAAPVWRTVLHAVAIYCGLIFDGTLGRFWRAHWRFATFITYPHFVLLNEMIWSLVPAVAAGWLSARLGLTNVVGIPIAVVVFFAALWAFLRYTEQWTYLLYLMSDTIFTSEFAHRRRPDWDARIDRFAGYLADAVSESDADEMVIVGHSSGSFLGVEILSRALERDPGLGRHGPRVVLLTIGGNLPIVGFLPASEDFRRRLGQLAVEPAIDWIDCQSRKDVMNFYPFDPIAGHGLDAGPARRNPIIVPVRFRDIIKPENYNRFRWKFFRVHFQFVMANERPQAYDFFMIVCGPVPLRERADAPAAALALATGGLARQTPDAGRPRTAPAVDPTDLEQPSLPGS